MTNKLVKTTVTTVQEYTHETNPPKLGSKEAPWLYEFGNLKTGHSIEDTSGKIFIVYDPAKYTLVKRTVERGLDE